MLHKHRQSFNLVLLIEKQLENGLTFTFIFKFIFLHGNYSFSLQQWLLRASFRVAVFWSHKDSNFIDRLPTNRCSQVVRTFWRVPSIRKVGGSKPREQKLF